MSQPLIEVKEVTKGFDGRTVLDRVSFKLFKGQVLAIIGKSGVGKSVLLKHIIGLLQPDQGEILFNGRSLYQMSTSEKNACLEKISYMFQNNALFNAQTVYENVAMPLLYRRRMNRKEIERKVMARLEQMELVAAAGKYPAELSGGMQKRVALARALITEPDIVLFDEPTTGQDPIRKNTILSMIAGYQRQYNFSAILISHDMPDIFFISNIIVALHEGRVIFQGSPEAFEQFEHPFRSEFVHSLELLQQALTGLYSKRQFKIRYQTDLVQNPYTSTYSVALIDLADWQAVTVRLGYAAAQEMIMATGAFISKHFTAVGGFSMRLAIDRFVTLLPHTEPDEARRLVDAFGSALIQEGIIQLERVMPAPPECERPVHICVSAGVGQGTAQTEVGTVIDAAHANLAPLVQFNVKCREE